MSWNLCTPTDTCWELAKLHTNSNPSSVSNQGLWSCEAAKYQLCYSAALRTSRHVLFILSRNGHIPQEICHCQTQPQREHSKSVFQKVSQSLYADKPFCKKKRKETPTLSVSKLRQVRKRDGTLHFCVEKNESRRKKWEINLSSLRKG